MFWQCDYTKYDYDLCGQWKSRTSQPESLCVCVCVILVSLALLSHLLLNHCPLPPPQNCVCVKGEGWRVEGGGGKQGEE